MRFLRHLARMPPFTFINSLMVSASPTPFSAKVPEASSYTIDVVHASVEARKDNNNNYYYHYYYW